MRYPLLTVSRRRALRSRIEIISMGGLDEFVKKGLRGRALMAKGIVDGWMSYSWVESHWQHV